MQINLQKLGSTLLKILPYVAIIVLLCFLLVKCENEKKLENALLVSNKETTHFKNKLGTITAEKEVLVLTKKQLEDLVLSKDAELLALSKEFSKVKTIIKTKVEVKFDSIIVPFETKIPCNFERNGSIFHKWYNFGYKVNQDGLSIEPFQTWTDITTITGFKRKWFWGKETYYTNVTSSNPYIQIPEIKTIEVQVPKRFYDTILFKIGVGFVGGFLIAK